MEINGIELNPLKTYIIDFDVWKNPHVYVVDPDYRIDITGGSLNFPHDISLESLPEIEDERTQGEG